MDVTFMVGGVVVGESRAAIRDEYIALVTRDSRAAWVSRESEVMTVGYVRGLWVVESVRRESRRSFDAWTSLSVGRLGVARDGFGLIYT